MRCGSDKGSHSVVSGWKGCDFMEIVEKKETNADMIRNMSDEELAEFLAVHDLGLKGNDLPMLTDWLEWLQSEAE